MYFCHYFVQLYVMYANLLHHQLCRIRNVVSIHLLIFWRPTTIRMNPWIQINRLMKVFMPIFKSVVDCWVLFYIYMTQKMEIPFTFGNDEEIP